ncbi:MAG: DNRLRE domain-containing protein, partial [Actinomycetota bacterium]|nr:DNRLRE domain-containing protein [Actinomycetota bacterium]
MFRITAALVAPLLTIALVPPAAIAAETASSTATATTTASPLAFDMPATSTLRASSRKVFAHYFPPLPISLDNQDPASDYYQRNFLKPDGEGGKHAAYGGYLRDRPVGRPIRGTSWRLQDLQDEVRQAIDAGIDGFALNLMVFPPSTSHQVTTARTIMKAAETVDPGFKIMLMVDLSGRVPSLSKTDIAKFLAELGASPAAYRVNGKLVISAFKAEQVAPSWWTELFTVLQANHGISTVFHPTFLNEAPYRDAFAPIMAASGNWGNRNPAWNDPTSTCTSCPVPRIKAVHALNGGTMKWMQPVSVQDQRPNQAIFDEAQNTQNLRNTWKIARDGAADLVQIPTWNDYTEGAQIAPTGRSGYAWLDLNTYYTTWYKLGTRPAIVRDTVYLTHRIQRVAATPTYPQTSFMKLRGGSPARDTVEALTFLTAPATVTITVGANTHSCAAPAGEGVCTVPLSPGTVSAKVVRNSTTVASVTSPHKVTTTPYVQDFTYVAASSGRQGTSGATVTPVDTSAPSAPSALAATATGSSVSLTWGAATDNVGVTQYEVHRSTTAGFSATSTTQVASVSGTTFTNDAVPAGTWYFRVVARDAAGNRSAPSAEATAVVAAPTATPTPTATPITTATPTPTATATPTPATTVAVVPSADTYVNEGAAATNYGTSSSLASRGNLGYTSYTRFAVPATPAGKTLTGAALQFRTTTDLSSGSAEAHKIYVASDAWAETTATWSNKPAVTSTVLGTVPAGTVSDRQYTYPLSVTGLAPLAGTSATLALTNAGTDSLWFWSRNHAATTYRPQLVLTY